MHYNDLTLMTKQLNEFNNNSFVFHLDDKFIVEGVIVLLCRCR
jgi:hypothetical protein